jgi:hypothetical protein
MSGTRAPRVRKRLGGLLGPRDDVVWVSLQDLDDGALTGARLLERRLHHGDDGRLSHELRSTAERTDEALRHLNRHLHNTFAAPLERDDALALGAGLDRVAQVCADLGAGLDAFSSHRGRHEARRAVSVLTTALERLVAALADLAAGRSTADAPSEARTYLAEGREFVRRGLADVLSAGLSAEGLLSWKDVYDRLDAAFEAARDVERLVDAVELRGRRG